MTQAIPHRRRASVLLAMVAGATVPGLAEAHVKWFCGPIDPLIPPAPMREVFSALFWTCLLGFAALVGIGALVDAGLARWSSRGLARPTRSAIAPGLVDLVVRVGLAIYAICLWRDIAVVLWADDATGAILTPDLLERNRLVGLVQLAVAGLVLVPRLSLVAGAGLAFLYALGVAKFGPFYMIDYLFFVGVAIYVALGDPALRRFRELAAWRIPIMTGSLALSLMWTAVEKFLFPEWTVAVLLRHPSIAAGFALPSVTTVAGFVEFSLSFYLLVGRPVLVRAAAVLLVAVFVVAMPEFGVVDVVGHIPVIVILAATLIEGETPLQRRFRGPRSGSGAVASAGAVLARYVATLVVLTGLYYGLHAASAWSAGRPVTAAQAATPRPLP